MIAEITGARVARGIVDNDPDPKPRLRVAVSVDRISRLLGLELTAAHVADLLRPLEFDVDGDADALEVGVPLHRLDVSTAADIAEEVARAHGYERIPGKLPRADDLSTDEITAAMAGDKKAVAGSLKWVLLDRIGRARIVDGREIDPWVLSKSMRAGLRRVPAVRS